MERTAAAMAITPAAGPVSSIILPVRTIVPIKPAPASSSHSAQPALAFRATASYGFRDLRRAGSAFSSIAAASGPQLQSSSNQDKELRSIQRNLRTQYGTEAAFLQLQKRLFHRNQNVQSSAAPGSSSGEPASSFAPAGSGGVEVSSPKFAISK